MTESLPYLDRGALTTADLAYIHTDGAPSQRVEAAIRAYLWSKQVAEATGLHPSLNMLLDQLFSPATTTSSDTPEIEPFRPERGDA